MKAILITNYGSPDVLHLGEVAKPTPKDNEVLIRIRAASATKGDCEIRSFKMLWFIWIPMRLYMGVRRPRKQILGQELSGEIEAVGKDVKRFKQGDPVFGTTGFNFGAYAEYACLPAESKASDDGQVLTLKPSNMTYEQAATAPVAGLVALGFMRKANIQHGERVLINGAGGSIGTFSVQFAKYYGAEVTVVDSAEKFDMLRSIGADHFIDYAQEDFTRNGETYDVILDVVGNSSFSRCIKSLRQMGRYLLANPKLSQIFRGLWISKTSSKRIMIGGNETTEDLNFLKELIEAGNIESVIDRCYPLEQTAEAHRYVETGRKKGNVVITVATA